MEFTTGANGNTLGRENVMRETLFGPQRRLSAVSGTGRWRWFVLAGPSLIAGASVVACSSSVPGASSSSTSDGGAEAGRSTVAGTIGASGGTVAAHNVLLTIPAGALASDIKISISPSGAPVPRGYTALSAIY